MNPLAGDWRIVGMKAEKLDDLHRLLCQVFFCALFAAAACSCSTSRDVDPSTHVAPTVSQG